MFPFSQFDTEKNQGFATIKESKYQTVANAELKFGLDVSNYIGTDSIANSNNKSQTFKLTPGSIDGANSGSKAPNPKGTLCITYNDCKVKCCTDVLEGNPILKE